MLVGDIFEFVILVSDVFVAVGVGAGRLVSQVADVSVQRALGLTAQFVQFVEAALVNLAEIACADEMVDGLVERPSGSVVETEAV